MNQASMHGATRGLYEGIPDAGAWQNSLRALSEVAYKIHTSMQARESRQLRIRHETARTQRKSIFLKTGS